jgi:hypothetical protein
MVNNLLFKGGKMKKNNGLEKKIKKELIDIINKSKLEEIIYEPRFVDGYELEKSAVIGSTITIRTTFK